MKWTEEYCKEALRAAAVDGVVSYGQAAKYAMSLPTMAKRRFGSFAEACNAAGLKSASEVAPHFDTCRANGCNRPTSRPQVGYCEACYMRRRRKGHTGYKQWAELLDHSQGYKLLYAPNHDIGTPGQQSRVYEHRAVYYRAHGEGPFNCYWCGAVQTWQTMHVDHLDDNKTNNSVSNLVASCPTCNIQRGHHKMVRTMRDTRARQLKWRGITMSIPDWADLTGIPAHTIKARLKAGWEVERTLTQPRGVSGPRGKLWKPKPHNYLEAA